jgi:hypothetical protein
VPKKKHFSSQIRQTNQIHIQMTVCTFSLLGLRFNPPATTTADAAANAAANAAAIFIFQ